MCQRAVRHEDPDKVAQNPDEECTKGIPRVASACSEDFYAHSAKEINIFRYHLLDVSVPTEPPIAFLSMKNANYVFHRLMLNFEGISSGYCSIEVKSASEPVNT
jgi:hypothetical protein